MWTAVASLVSICCCYLVLRQFRELRDFPTQVLLSALMLRQLVQAFPDQTVRISVGGMSIPALVSILIVLAFLAVMDGRVLRLRHFVPLYGLFGIVLLSTVINVETGGLGRVAAKWILFIGILTLTYRSILLYGLQRTMRAILSTLILPLVLQVFSIALGTPKANEADGSASYIGGYFHEAVFSTVMVGFTVAASLSRPTAARSLPLVVTGFVSLLLANYRTSVIAGLPVLAACLVLGLLKLWHPRLRSAVVIAGIALTVAAVPVILTQLPDRYSQVADVIEDSSALSEAPQHLDDTERYLLSGRLYIWSHYLEAHRNASFARKLIGFGPEAWDGVMPLIAHNTFVSYIYEYGLIGVALLLVVMGYNALIVFRIPDRDLRFRLLSAHAGFALLNLSATPFWSNEGLTVYAILVATTWAMQLGTARSTASSIRSSTGHLPGRMTAPHSRRGLTESRTPAP